MSLIGLAKGSPGIGANITSDLSHHKLAPFLLPNYFDTTAHLIALSFPCAAKVKKLKSHFET